jgi:tetratricopeptide (TPR) repeat protein
MLPAQVELHAWLAQLAAYTADWERVEQSTEASAALAEREGLVGKLCLPYALRGLLRWREGRIGEATVLFHRAHELAEQVGWSEIAFQALFGLAIALRDQGDLDGATAALDQAIEVCERAGLIAQSIQATGSRAVILALAHRPKAAAEAAAMTAQMAERLHYPLGRAAALEARGVSDEDPVAGAALLAEAEEAWRALDRPLEATRAHLLAGQVLLGHDDARAGELLATAAAESERLGVAHLAEKARTAAATAERLH